MSAVIVPGSYDPVTLGHLDVIARAAKKYDEVYAVVFINPEKNYTFSLDDRVRMLMLATDGLPNVLVSWSSGLVIDYMREHGIEKIVKGYRNCDDLEYERKMAEWNFKHGGYETELIGASLAFTNVSSTLARDKILKGDPLCDVLPAPVIQYLKQLRQKSTE